VTIRRSRYRSLTSLQRDNRRCRACAEAGYPLESPPVFEGRPGQRAYILGQAPGWVEGAERRPWRGRAGRTLRAWLDLDEDRFYATFYCASVTRWREWELALLRPALILTVGGLALRRLLGPGSLTEAVGTTRMHGETTVVPLPHPSGASGWLNEAANRERLDTALQHVRRELAAL
jgi:uracil-DNA glycosylase